jgi:FtsP/CotA-like multicopper oxidase with cupredoxin domain
MLINGENMHLNLKCENRVFVRGKTYDVHIINPTVDIHPMHIHLITS